MWRSVSASLCAALAGLGSAGPSSAQVGSDGRPDGEVLLVQMVSVTGTLRRVPQRAGEGSALEIDGGAMGRFRIEESGLGAELAQHVGKDVTVAAFVEPIDREGRKVLRVESYTLHSG